MLNTERPALAGDSHSSFRQEARTWVDGVDWTPVLGFLAVVTGLLKAIAMLMAEFLSKALIERGSTPPR
jgi:hypothetical protein